MTAATMNKINDAIKPHGIEVVKGACYFYFMGLSDDTQADADKIDSVMCPQLRCMPLEEWVEHVEDALTRP